MRLLHNPMSRLSAPSTLPCSSPDAVRGTAQPEVTPSFLLGTGCRQGPARAGIVRSPHHDDAQTPLSVVGGRAPHARLPPAEHPPIRPSRTSPATKNSHPRARKKSVAPLLLRHTDTCTPATAVKVALINAVASDVTQTPPIATATPPPALPTPAANCPHAP